MTDEVDELLHEDELEIPLSEELEAEAEGLRIEEFGAAGFDANLDEDGEAEADESAADEDEAEGAEILVLTPAKGAAEVAEAADEDDLEGLPEDPEASLDEILRAQLTASDEEGFVDVRVYAEEDRAVREFALEDGGAMPRGPDEFVCQSCFLVKNRRQLADTDHGFCRDCA